MMVLKRATSDNAGKMSEFVTDSECIAEKLREWHCNTDMIEMSVHCARFVMKDLERENKAGSRS